MNDHPAELLDSCVVVPAKVMAHSNDGVHERSQRVELLCDPHMGQGFVESSKGNQGKQTIPTMGWSVVGIRLDGQFELGLGFAPCVFIDRTDDAQRGVTFGESRI